MAPRVRQLIAIVLLLGAACAGSGQRKPNAVSAAGLVRLSGEPSGSGRCGPYRITWRSPDLGDDVPDVAARLEVRRGSKVVLDAHGRDDTEQLWGRWCGDMTGDGRPELGYEVFTNGAHCCFGGLVRTLEGPTLLDADLGNADLGGPEQLDGKGALEIATSSDVLAYFDLPYAASPFLPRVFAFSKARYADATTKFPAHIRRSLGKAWEQLDEALEEHDEFVESSRGAALGAFGHYVLLGEEKEGLREVTSRVPEDVATWLREHAEEATRTIRGEGTTAGT